MTVVSTSRPILPLQGDSLMPTLTRAEVLERYGDTARRPPIPATNPPAGPLPYVGPPAPCPIETPLDAVGLGILAGASWLYRLFCGE
jgi:hypothetical protein